MIAAVSNPYSLIAFALGIGLLLVRTRQSAKNRQLLIGSVFLLVAAVVIAGMWSVGAQPQQTAAASNPSPAATPPAAPGPATAPVIVIQTNDGKQGVNAAYVGSLQVDNHSPPEQPK